MPHTRYTPLPAFQFNPSYYRIDKVRERKAERKGGKEREREREREK